MLPSVILTTSAPETILLSRLHGWPMRSPADASPSPSRVPAHGSGQFGSLILHRSGLAPPTPCRFDRRTIIQELRTKIRALNFQDFSNAKVWCEISTVSRYHLCLALAGGTGQQRRSRPVQRLPREPNL